MQVTRLVVQARIPRLLALAAVVDNTLGATEWEAAPERLDNANT